jgi:hypothetical protein
MNDIILNWSKMKKFIRTENRDNSINGKDRGYTHEEIQKILEFSDQRLNLCQKVRLIGSKNASYHKSERSLKRIFKFNTVYFYFFHQISRIIFHLYFYQ